MQIKGLHKNIYRLYSYASRQESLDKYRNLYHESVTAWEALKNEGNSDEICQRFSGVSRATYFRRKKILRDLEKGIAPPSKRPKKLNKPRWGESEKQIILRIRRENPTYGKAKIAVILKRDYGAKISESTVGRILKYLKKNGLVIKSLSAARTKRKRLFKGHANTWNFKEYDKMTLGERVQIDHMTVTKNGVVAKHFGAWERKSKYLDANVYSNAKSSSAKKFLLEFVANAPFKVLSIQVDGGSEFMAEFEEACKDLGIPLIVLPPAKPKYNGGIERSNRIFREEFYGNTNMTGNSVCGISRELLKNVKKYNSYRPHNSLKGKTPLEYINYNSRGLLH